MKEPIGLEHLTSSRFLDFMERSWLQDAYFGPFNNGFSPVRMFMNTYNEERGTWAVGVFKNASNIFTNGVGDGEYNVTSRITATPFFENEGRHMMHLGLAASHRDLDDGALRIRTRQSLRSGNPGPFNPIMADTGTFLGDDQNLLAAEAAVVWGPWLFQSEYVASYAEDAIVGVAPIGTHFTQGWYTEAMYFLTGEHRPYNKKTGAFDRIIPNENYFLVPSDCGPLWGLGAWQVGARYAMLDLRDAGLDGGIVEDVTLGLNWFLNPNFKMQWNYVLTFRDAPIPTGSGEIHGAGMRAAYDF